MTSELSDARRTVYELEKAERERMLVDIQSWSQERLSTAMESCDHDRPEWNDGCWHSEAESLYRHREAEAESKLPGARHFGGGSSYHCEARELQVDDELCYRPLPGTSNFFIVQVESVATAFAVTKVCAVKTNTDEEHRFFYPSDVAVDYFRPRKP